MQVLRKSSSECSHVVSAPEGLINHCWFGSLGFREPVKGLLPHQIEKCILDKAPCVMSVVLGPCFRLFST